MKINWFAILPLLIVAFLAGLLWHGIGRDPHKLPSTLIGKPLPDFDLPTLTQSPLSNASLKGQAVLVHVWSTWCSTCRYEHQDWMRLAESCKIPLYGLLYKDEPAKGQAWLDELGNPYQAVAVDVTGHVGINWGVYGTPETFVLDKQGKVRYRHPGPVTPENWEETIYPLLRQLSGNQFTC